MALGETYRPTSPASGDRPVPEAIAASIQSAQGRGRRLGGGLRGRLQHWLGRPLPEAQIHSGAEARRLNRALKARAFTVGRDIFLGSAAEQTERPGSEPLLAHELSHVLDNLGQPGPPVVQRWPLTIGNKEYDDADAFADLVNSILGVPGRDPRAILGAFIDRVTTDPNVGFGANAGATKQVVLSMLRDGIERSQRRRSLSEDDLQAQEDVRQMLNQGAPPAPAPAPAPVPGGNVRPSRGLVAGLLRTVRHRLEKKQLAGIQQENEERHAERSRQVRATAIENFQRDALRGLDQEDAPAQTHPLAANSNNDPLPVPEATPQRLLPAARALAEAVRTMLASVGAERRSLSEAELAELLRKK
ncbi:MAG: DUF4157 domain-containing protein [Ardenticatenales bacterium]|nr:DUF4157 domain-containing protein [Ardenticatenales bacterium]